MIPIAKEKTDWIYFAASKPHGVLYVGMTSDLAGRTWEHRERAMKRWRRDWKIQSVEKDNPTWRDLFGDVVRADGLEW